MKYALINLKGGVGKTTTAINLAYGLSKAKRKVLLIDMDGQANATHTLLSQEPGSTIADALSLDIKELDKTLKCIYHTPYGFDIIPANFKLFRLESLTVQNSDIPSHKKLYNIINYLKAYYDDFVIDNNPLLETWATNSIFAAKTDGLVIIPIKIDKYALDGFNEVISKINRINENFECEIPYKVLITMKNRNNVDKTVYEELKNMIGNNIYETTIRNQSKPIAKASFNHNLIIDNEKAKVADDYKAFIKEVIYDKH